MKSRKNTKTKPLEIQLGMRWYRYNPAYHLAFTAKMKAEEKAEYFDTLNQVLILEERGVNPEADRMIDNSHSISAIKKKTADDAWRLRKEREQKEREKNANAMQPQCGCNADAMPYRPTEPTRPTIKPEIEPKKPDQSRNRDLKFGMETGDIIGAGSGADKYGRILAVPQNRLAEFAAQKLRDADQTRAVFAYKKAIGVIGPEAFRSLLEQFIGDIAVGDCKTVNKLGAVFVQNRLKPAVEAKRNRGTA
jgi:hypothetical protein